jgi:hypothetical protein
MADQSDNLDQLKKGTAILIACIVQTLSKSDSCFKEQFVRQMALADYELPNNLDQESRIAMELLSLTRELLTSEFAGRRLGADSSPFF